MLRNSLYWSISLVQDFVYHLVMHAAVVLSNTKTVRYLLKFNTLILLINVIAKPITELFLKAENVESCYENEEITPSIPHQGRKSTERENQNSRPLT
jgi:hypothetical protein